MVHSRRQVFVSYAPITLLHKLYLRLGFITVMSIRTKCISVCTSLKLTVTSTGKWHILGANNTSFINTFICICNTLNVLTPPGMGHGGYG